MLHVDDKYYDKICNLIIHEHKEELDKFLIKNNLSYDSYFSTGETIFFKTCRESKYDMIRHMVYNGARVNIKTKKEDNGTPLIFACDTNNIDLVKCLLEFPNISLYERNVLDALRYILLVLMERKKF